jgi:hypothetical protein
LRQPRQTACALGQRARRHYWLAPRSDDAVGAAVLGQGAAEVAAEAARLMPPRSRTIGCGSAGASSPMPDAYLQAFSAAGFQEMRPARVPAIAGWGNAVTGISRADSASANATTLRQRLRRCNRSGRLGQSAVGCRVAQPVSSADGTMNVRPNRRLTHRRASLALEAPIARPWISAVNR